MNFITTLFSQLGQVFNAQTAGRKLLLLAVVMGSMVGMVMLTRSPAADTRLSTPTSPPRKPAKG
jgi:hypothetical protein